MGSKFKPETNLNPGPGQYYASDEPRANASGSVRIGSAKRKDLW